MKNRNFAILIAAAATIALSACSDDDPIYSEEPGPTPSGDTLALTSAGKLVSFNRATPGSLKTSLAVSGLNGSETLVGIDIRPADGKLYALGSAGRLYTVDTATGAASQVCTLAAAAGDDNPFTALTGTAFGVDFNPVPDRLRVVSDTGQNLRINVTPTAGNCAATTDGALNVGGSVRTGLTAAAYTNSFASACRTTLYYLDSTTDKLLSTSAPNEGVVSEIGALGIAFDTATGFDVQTGADGSNTAIAALNVGSSPLLYSINLSTGVASAATTIGLAAGESVRGLAAPTPASAPAQAVGELLGLSTGNKLVSFNSAAPGKLCTSTAITGLGTDVPVGMDTRPATGELFLVTTNKLYTVNPTTGAATAGASLSTALSGTHFGVDFNPVPDRLRVTSDTGQNLRINVADGAVTVDGNLSANGLTSVAYSNSVKGGDAASLFTTLYALDTIGNQLARIGGNPASGGACPADTGNPNCGIAVSVGPLGADIGQVGGFDIEGRSGKAVFAAQLGADTSSTLYTVNLGTGAATLSNGASSAVGGGEALKGLTYAAAPAAATVFGVTTSNKLVSFSPAAPGTVAAVGTISVGAGETVLGIDFRTANGKLYALTGAGKLYTVDPVTAAATLASTVSGVTLASGGEFGIDFNPVPDRLRVVNDSEQNLRINVDSGVTTADSALTPAGSVFGAGYINNFAGTATTALYGVNSAGDNLVLIGANPATGGTCPDAGNPNCGVVTSVGALTVDVSNVGDLDIAGGGNGFALAALQPAAGGVSGLYRINLATGAATKIGDIAAPGSEAVRGIAVQLK